MRKLDKLELSAMAADILAQAVRERDFNGWTAACEYFTERLEYIVNIERQECAQIMIACAERQEEEHMLAIECEDCRARDRHAIAAGVYRKAAEKIGERGR